MTDFDKKMDPKHSPTRVPTTGVKRVNNLPLLIGVAIALIFIALIIMVAFKRSAQETVMVEEKISVSHKDNQKIVAEIIGDNKQSGVVKAGEIIESVSNSLPNTDPVSSTSRYENIADLPIPRPHSQDLMLEEPVDTEMDNIRKAKIQAFEEAVKASMRIALPETRDTSVSNNDIRSKQIMVKKQLEAIKSNDLNASYQERLQQIKSMMANKEGEPGEERGKKTDPFLLLESGKNRWELESSIEAPKTLFELRAGGVIPGLMISEVDPRFPGQIHGQISSNVYDTATGKYLLIPQGSRLIGTYASDIGYAQEAVLIIWQRIIFPDGKAIDLGSMPGADSAGVAGFKDQVNNHYARTFGSALLMTGIVGGISYSQQLNNTSTNNQPTAGSVLSEALGQQLGQVTAQMIMKNLNVAPDLHIRVGYPFNVMVTKDITFNKPYQSFDYRR